MRPWLACTCWALRLLPAEEHFDADDPNVLGVRVEWALSGADGSQVELVKRSILLGVGAVRLREVFVDQ